MDKLQQKFREHYTTWAKPLYVFIYSYLGSKEESQDLVQEIFVKYWEKLKTTAIENPKSYLFRSARNLLINKKEHKLVVEKYRGQLTLSNDIEDPHFQIEVNEFKDRLMDAIKSLPEGQRVVFMMNRIEGLKYKEIAERLDLSQKAVEKRMGIALKALRKIYNKI